MQVVGHRNTGVDFDPMNRGGFLPNVQKVASVAIVAKYVPPFDAPRSDITPCAG
jgi:hypothetical protein